jgi:D-glycero-D-manno-heptose 1,7-bisphosphate phosphatase
LLALAGAYGGSLAGVPCIGDSGRDLAAAAAVGARPILVLTGNGTRTLAELGDDAIEQYPDLAHAVDRLLAGAGA